MRVKHASFSNDIVSLSVMALMAVAFIAAQGAQAGPTAAVVDEVASEQQLVSDENFNLRSIGE